MYPLSNLSPSTYSTSVLRVFPSYTVTEPSGPIFSKTSEISVPISLSPLAEIVATFLMSSLPLRSLDCFLSSSITASTANCIPHLKSIGFIPAATLLQPSLYTALARIVAVVVPSPA